jgi:hypothetical protein
LQYVDLEIVRYAAKLLETVERNGKVVMCEAKEGEGICGDPVAYLVPDATPAGGGGQDIERRPAIFCREHLEEMLGHPPEEQPIFKRLEEPGDPL